MKEELKTMRENLNISIQQVADDLDTTVRTINDIESGKRKRSDTVFWAFVYYLQSKILENGIQAICDKYQEKIDQLTEEQEFIYNTYLHIALQQNTQAVCDAVGVNVPAAGKYMNLC